MKYSGITLTLCVLVSLFLRVVLPHDAIFTEVGIKFSGNDAYYHMMLVDRLLATFPHINPFTSDVPATFFHYLLFTIVWIAGLGYPSPHLVDVIGVYFPAILGVLTIFPVYFLGKELWGRTAGLLGAVLIAVIPGEFLGRSILGYTDHDIFLTILTTLSMLFLVKGIKQPNHKKQIINGLWAGLCLGLFLLTWYGALLFIFIIDLYLIAQVSLNHFKGKPSKYLFWTFTPALILATGLYHLEWTAPATRYILFASCLLPIVLLNLSHILKPRWLLPLCLISGGLAIGIIFHTVNHPLFESIVSSSSLFFSGTSPTDLTTSEMKPLFYPQDTFTLILVSSNFNVSSITFIIGLIFMVYFSIKKDRPEWGLVVIWSLVILVGTIEHRRFATFLVVNIVLLTGYVGQMIYQRITHEK